MATPKHTSITVDEGAGKAFIKTKMDFMRKDGDYSLTHGTFLMLCLAAFKKGVN